MAEAMRQKGSAKRRRSVWLLLALLLLAGLGLRVWFLSSGLDNQRFWDERYSLLNVRAFLLKNQLEPVNTFYPSPVFNVPPALLMKASDALYEATGKPVFKVIDHKRRIQATGYFLGRLTQTLYAVAAILLTFLIGRRVFSAEVGLLGALFLTFAPALIRPSAVIKPDSLLMMTSLLAFYASLAAVDNPRTSRYLAAGAAIALAMSGKLTGGVIAISLIAATLVLGWHNRRRFVWLVVAGATSVLTFIAVNPYWMNYFHYHEYLKKDYALHAAQREMHRVEIPGRVVGFLTDQSMYGVVIGALGLLALAWLTASVVWPGRDRPGRDQAWTPERVKRLMLVVFPPFFTLLYMVQTAHFKPNNFLPIVPYVFLALGWMLHRGWRMEEARPSLRRRLRPLATLAIVAIVGLTASSGFAFVYQTVTPATLDYAKNFIERRLEPDHSRLIHAERWRLATWPWHGRERLHKGRSGVRWLDSLEPLDHRTLDSSDGLIFRQDRLSGDHAEVYVQAIARAAPADVRRFEPRLFRTRGPAAVAIVHRFELQLPAERLVARRCPDRGGCLVADLPADLVAGAAAGDLFSLSTHSRPGMMGDLATPTVVRVGGEESQLITASIILKVLRCVSERFSVSAGSRELRLIKAGGAEFGPGDPAMMTIDLLRWRAPED